MPISRRFTKNTAGRDFVVGDLGGHFDWMDQWLVDKKFDRSKDRLFGVGDLIDRGPRSADSLKWYLEIMEECVRGNHEDMMIAFHRGLLPASMCLVNGGAWYVGMMKEERQPYIDAFSTMPYAIEIETDVGLIGVTHAECMESNWHDFMNNPLRCRETRYSEPSCTWGRDRLNLGSKQLVNGVFLIIVGHTIVSEPTRLANHLFIDTGGSDGKEPTVVQIQGDTTC